MSVLRLVPFLGAVSVAALAACTHPEATGGPDARPARSEDRDTSRGVVATVDGEAITWDELEDEAAPHLARLRQQEYEIRRQVLETLITDRLLSAAAREQGTSTEELIRQNVEEGVSKPPPAQVEEIYERNVARFAGQTREQAFATITGLLQERMVAERQRAYEQTLRDGAEVAVHLDAPRAAVDIPQGASARGPEDAPVTIVEFTDYQCPFCHRAQGVMDRILDEYEGKVRLVHLDFPLQNHPGAVPAARAARCAGEQGRFWDYHHGLMTQKGDLDEADLARRAATLELDRGRFGECLSSDRYLEEIRNETGQGSDLGVTGTPAYFINGRMVSGAQPFSAFADIIEDELAGH